MELLEFITELNFIIPIIVGVVTWFVTQYLQKEKHKKTYIETIELAKIIAHRYDMPANDFLEELLTKLHEANVDSKEQEQYLIDNLSKEKRKMEEEKN